MEQFEQLLNESQSGYKEGLIKGRVVKKSKDGVFIDLKTKADRFIPKEEFLKDEWEAVKVDDELEVLVSGGKTSYSKARALVALQELKSAFLSKTPVEIKVLKPTKGGYTASYKGINIFLPASQAGRVKKVANNISCRALVIKFEEEDNNVVCSVSELENLEKELALKRFFEERKVGEVVSCRIKTIIEKGVFVDLGEAEGFIPFSELTYKRIKTPKELLRVGDVIDAKIIEIDTGKKKITLSKKALEEKPWDRFVKNYKEGDKVEGVVRNIINTGLFVEIMDGLDGFMHVSEISWTERVSDPNKYFSVGDEIKCAIKSIDEKNQKVSLSLKEIISNPWKEFVEAHPRGSVVTCKVKEIVNSGVVVELDNNLEGFIPSDCLAWSKVNEFKNSINIGQEITAKLIESSVAKRKLVFSIKDLTKDPWLEAKEKIKNGDEVEGIVTGFTDKVVFFEVLPHVEGVVKKAEFERGKKDAGLTVGDKMMLLVKDFDFKNRKLLLTYRGLELKQEREALAEYKNQNGAKVTLGDFLKK